MVATPTICADQVAATRPRSDSISGGYRYAAATRPNYQTAWVGFPEFSRKRRVLMRRAPARKKPPAILVDDGRSCFVRYAGWPLTPYCTVKLVAALPDMPLSFATPRP